MNTWSKLPDGTWAVACDAPHNPGDIVQVYSKARGTSKPATLTERLAGFPNVWRIADNRPKAQTVGDLSGVLALFTKAKTHLRYPAIVLGVPEAGLTIRLSLAGPGAKVPGSVTVLDGERGEDGRDWFGRILTDGTYQPSRTANGRTEPITAKLRAFAADPAGVAAEHGRLTGRCSFCNTALKDERSTAVGYGRICAAHYDLPWGTERHSFTAEGA